MGPPPTPPLEPAGVDTSSSSEGSPAPVAVGVPRCSPPRGPQSRLSAVAVAALLPLGGLAAVGTPKASIGAAGAAPRRAKAIKGPLADMELVGALHLVHLPAAAQCCECPRHPGPRPPAMVPREVANPSPCHRHSGLATSPPLLAFARCHTAPGSPCLRREAAPCFGGAWPAPGIAAMATSPRLGPTRRPAASFPAWGRHFVRLE